MAKHNCAICGAEIGLISEQKLADGNFICRKVCSKKTFKIFDKVSATLGDVTAHIEQIEKGTKIWNELLLPLKKAKDKSVKLKTFGVGNTLLHVSPSTGLVALVETRRKIFIFGKTELACVYRLADLVQYDYEEEKVKNSEGKMETKEFCAMMFKDTTEQTDPAEVTKPAEPTLKELIIGTWEDQETEYKETFTFNADGTGKYGFEDGGYWEYTFTYAWYDGDYVEFTYDDDGSTGGFTVRIEGDVMYVSNAAVVDMPLVRK